MAGDGISAGKPDGSGGGKPVKISKLTSTVLSASAARIAWTTNVAADSTIEYGKTSLLGSSVTDSALVTKHSEELTGLEADTQYFYRVISRDSTGREVISAVQTFTTQSVDLTAPVISNISSTLSGTEATINWQTHEPADTQVEYGTTTDYGQFTALNLNLVSSHSQVISGLSPNTTYHYRVLSRDAAGNVSVSGDFTFTTSSNTGNAATIFLNFGGAFIPQWGSYSNLAMAAFTGAASVINNVLQAIIEKFSPFNLNITLTNPFAPSQTYSTPTEEANAKYAYYTQNRIQEVVVTGTNSSTYFGGNYGGIAYVNSFTSSIVNSVFVFASNLSNTDRYIWEASAHETGHAFGLQHQSQYDANGNRIAEYYGGVNGVAPIMGNSYNKRGQWWYGTSTSATTYQNDFAVITKSANGFGYRSDEAGDNADSAAAFGDIFGTSFGTQGVLTSTADRDYYEFTTTQDGLVSFSSSVAAYGAMLDSALEIRDANGNLISQAATSSLGETISNYFLPAGQYFLVVRSQAVRIGDVGQFWINGTVPEGTTSTAGPLAPSDAQPSGGASDEGGGVAPSELAGSAGLTPAVQRTYFAIFFPDEPRTGKKIKSASVTAVAKTLQVSQVSDRPISEQIYQPSSVSPAVIMAVIATLAAEKAAADPAARAELFQLAAGPVDPQGWAEDFAGFGHSAEFVEKAAAEENTENKHTEGIYSRLGLPGVLSVMAAKLVEK